MIIKWIRKKEGFIEIADITEVVSSFNWGGSDSQAARTVEIAVANAPNDKNITELRLNLGTGDALKLIEEEKEIFYGEIQTAGKESETGTITYNATDLLGHLLRSTAIYNFSNTTPEGITSKVCADFEIEIGSIAKTNMQIKKMIIDGSTIYDIIMMAYTKAAKTTGEKYICRMNSNKLSVEIKGKIVANYVLSEESNITNTSYQETIENMVNVVKIYNESGKQIGEVKNDELVKKCGIYQQTYKKESGVNENTAAKNLLVGIEKQVSLEGIEGDLDCIAGNGVEVFDKATGLTGLFWIKNDTHTWENGIHTMSLELDFKNIMDEKEYTEVEG